MAIGEAQAGKCPCSLESLRGASSRDVFLISSKNPWADADWKKEVAKNLELSRTFTSLEAEWWKRLASFQSQLLLHPQSLAQEFDRLGREKDAMLAKTGRPNKGSLTACHSPSESEFPNQASFRIRASESARDGPIFFFHFFQARCFQFAIAQVSRQVWLSAQGINPIVQHICAARKQRRLGDASACQRGPWLAWISSEFRAHTAPRKRWCQSQIVRTRPSCRYIYRIYIPYIYNMYVYICIYLYIKYITKKYIERQ